MIDIEGPLVTAGLVAVIAAVVQVYGILQDKRHNRSQDTRDDARAPLEKRSMEMDIVDQSTVIMQRVVDSLNAQNQQLVADNQKLVSDTARAVAENALLRNQMMDMYIQMREIERRNDAPPD